MFMFIGGVDYEPSCFCLLEVSIMNRHVYVYCRFCLCLYDLSIRFSNGSDSEIFYFLSDRCICQMKSKQKLLDKRGYSMFQW